MSQEKFDRYMKDGKAHMQHKSKFALIIFVWFSGLQSLDIVWAKIFLEVPDVAFSFIDVHPSKGLTEDIVCLTSFYEFTKLAYFS